MNMEPASSPESNHIDFAKDAEPDAIRREFLRRFGAYAATTPAAVFALISPRTSKAICSDGCSDSAP